MLIHILALALSIVFLAKLILYLFFPARLASLTKPFVDAVKNHYLNAQIIGLAILILVGSLVANLIGFIPMVVAGWFWTLLYTLTIIPSFRHLSSLAPITKMVGSQDFKRDMQMLAGVHLAFALLIILVVFGFIG